MKKNLAIGALTLLAFTGCKKEELKLQPEVTLLTVHAERSDGDAMSPSSTYVSVWDASNNDLVYDLNKFSTLGEIKNTEGNKVKPIVSEKMSKNETASGVVSNYLFAVINLDKALSYDKESKSGKLLIKVETDLGYSITRPKVSLTELYWEREKSHEIKKIFKDDNALSFYEQW